MSEPVSVYTAAAYPVGGLTIYLLAPSSVTVVFAVCMAALGAGTAWFHYDKSGPSTDADHAAMNATLAALAVGAVGAPWGLVALSGFLAAAVVELWLDRPNRLFVVAMGWVGFSGAVASSHETLAIAGLVSFALAFAFWRVGRDLTHGLWHVLTATGLTLLWLGGVG